ncbi:MAG: hypothetical protein PVI97_00270 [Candidatus Thiodiazotropha sp.]|jgi:hypothetical protein
MIAKNPQAAVKALNLIALRITTFREEKGDSDELLATIAEITNAGRQEAYFGEEA